VKAAHLLALYRLAEMGAAKGFVSLSTGVIAKGLGVSQQTASRRLIEMQRGGLVERSASGRILRIKITKEGLSGLTEMYKVLKPVFESPQEELVLNAVVFSGLSEGSYYMSLEGYRKQFRSKLGFDPFPGTLNLRLTKESMTERRELEKYPSVGIEGFADKDRTYGGARCYPVLVSQKVHAAIVMPIRAHYGEDVIEIIAPDNLRRRLHLKDGDVVNIRVPFSAAS
jgi:riboflavin kinase, archaea type